MQKKSSYRVLNWTLLALSAASLATACVVTSGDGTLDGFGGEGSTDQAGSPATTGGSDSGTAGTHTTAGTGGSGTAGTNVGGANTAGTSSTTAGTSATAGDGAGGAAPVAYEVGLCQADDPTPALLPSCSPDAEKDKDNPCQVCMKAKCCTDWQGCFGSNPTTACFHGESETKLGQLDCIFFCFDDGAKDASDPEQLFLDCSAGCANQCDGPDGGLIMDSTNGIAGCAFDSCADECFPFQ